MKGDFYLFKVGRFFWFGRVSPRRCDMMRYVDVDIDCKERSGNQDYHNTKGGGYVIREARFLGERHAVSYCLF
jgi:hypothetical protein